MDAAVYKPEPKSGFGAIFRDVDGCALGMFSGRFKGCRSPFLAKLLGCRGTLRYIQEHVELDAQLVYEAIRSTEDDNSEFSFVIQNCRDLLRSMPHVSLSWVRRECNKAAHVMVRHAKLYFDFHIWADLLPDVACML